MNIEKPLRRAYKHLGIDELNKMQLTALDASAEGEDVMLLSPTGSGKTVGFLLPLLRNLDPALEGTVQALIMAPSRELALQIEQVWKGMKTGHKVNSVYGGHAVATEIQNFVEPPVVLIGTPGRLKQHLIRGSFDPSNIHTLVLDEFDKALEFGFWADMDEILQQLPEDKQILLTSATAAEELPDFLPLKNPKTLSFLKEGTPKGLTLHGIRTGEANKLDGLVRLISSFGQDSAIIFCNHRAAVDRIAQYFISNQLAFDSFHGGLEQNVRERTLIKFRNGSIQFLLTTDLASRGLDIPEIKHIVHYQLPQTEDAYIHRNGRTARMHAEGKAYLVFSEEDKLPPYIKSQNQIDWINIPEEYPIPELSEWATLYFSGGKKQKINKMDIMGLLGKKGQLERDEVGLIEIQDHASYAAIKREKLDEVIDRIKGQKVKKIKLKVAEAR
ncbi:DEAD/DEAH box helicase [Algivirga pacifica]|uniref:DEAD/DEAH box helicase n=1 Tax=Algivirga pacifica TaxID=1162670 RepID=A0ABP9D6X8_9BACT